MVKGGGQVVRVLVNPEEVEASRVAAWDEGFNSGFVVGGVLGLAVAGLLLSLVLA